jgi:hypothetical protein
MLKALNKAISPSTDKRESAAVRRDEIRNKYGLTSGEGGTTPSSRASVAPRHQPTSAPMVDPALAGLQSKQANATPASAPRAPRAALLTAPVRTRTDYSLTPEETALLDARINLFDESIVNLQRLSDEGAITLSHTQRSQLDHLIAARDAVDELRLLVPPSSGRALNGNEELAIAKLRVELETAVARCGKDLRELVLALPAEVVPRIHNADLLNILAADIGKELDANKSQFARIAPEVVPYIDRVKQTMTEEVDGAMREARLQNDILTTQGAAIEGFGQAGIDAHRHSTSGWLGRHGNTKVRHAAAHMGLNKALKPEEYAAGMHAELGARFGRLFDVSVEGERQVSINMKTGVAGYFSTPELLQIMEAMNDYVGRSRDKNAMEAFIKTSPDVEWATVDGERRLQLTASAKDRLGVAEGEALPEMSAQERLQTAVIGGAQGVKLSELKASIMQTFSPDLEKLGDRALSMLNLNPGLTHDKAVLIQALVDDLMAAPSAEKMLALVDQAIQDHGALWQADRFARDSGKTGVMLAELRGSLSRYMERNPAVSV